MDLSQWPKQDLLKYIDFLLHNYRVMDAFWFINLENSLGLDQACHFNEKVWGKVGGLAARDLKKRFGLTQPGLPGLVEALQLFPWTILIGYEFDLKPDELIITVPSCAAQAGRIRHGLGEYPCQAMHRAEFASFAQEIDPRIQVECVFAPPDPHPEDIHCRWRFTLA